MHAELSFDAVLKVEVPVGHIVQFVAPFLSWYVPTGQSKHSLPETLWYAPEGQITKKNHSNCHWKHYKVPSTKSTILSQPSRVPSTVTYTFWGKELRSHQWKLIPLGTTVTFLSAVMRNVQGGTEVSLRLKSAKLHTLRLLAMIWMRQSTTLTNYTTMA